MIALRGRSLRPVLSTSIAAVTGVALAIGLLSAPPALADTAPPSASTPPTVSADALPTVQVNGVVWSQVTVGNTVYATGSFTQTWPAGQSASSTNETARSNLLAYDITTGALITSFNHSLNQQGLAITASPDGSTVYVAGDFTTVDGVTRNHIAAFSTATGALTGFAPYVGGSARALAVNGSTVYVGGNFLNAGGATRTRLAAFTTGGALLSWAPTADVEVDAMVLSPDGSRVIVGGRFTTLNTTPASGLGALDSTSGATLSFAINNYIQDGGTSSKCGITSLAVDGSQVYGAGFAFGCGNFEGRFAADPDTGNVTWINDCHGDTYSVSPIGKVLYSVGHAHDCSAINGFPDTNPRTWHRAIAETTYATGTGTGPDSYGWNYNGQPDATQLDWYPTLSIGSYTGQSQAAWSVTGNSKYIALGGEFPSVNGTAQSGLVRFAVSSVAPNKVGPQVIGSNWKVTATSLSSGTERVSFPSNWDPDNTTLTYKVYRDSTANAPVYTTTTNSTFWQLPTLGFTDTGLVPGSTHQYKVFATDPFGNSTNSLWTSATVNGTGSGASSAYAQDVLNDGASNFWPLGETSGTTAYDYAGFDDMTENNGVTQGAPGPIANDSGTASTFNGSNQWAATSRLVSGPNTFSLEGWFRTTSTSGGLIAGFGDSNTALSGNYDRHIYLDAAGHVVFGVYNNAVYTVSTPNAYNDGAWHYVVGTLSSSGVALYVDGKLIGTNPNTTVGQNFSGYWRIGGDNLNGWPGAGSNYLAGSIDDVAVYPTALSAARVSAHYGAATGAAATVPPTASFTSNATNLSVAFDGSGSAATKATITGYAWDFGDGSTGNGVKPSHAYATAGTFTVKLTVTDSNGNTNSVSQPVTVTAPNRPPVAAFTSTCSAATCQFDATSSTDPDGSVASYAWTFGDGSSGTGATTSHVYAASGTDTVTLTVTDNAGATNSVSHTATVAVPSVFANDGFQRTVSNGWGTADTAGGAWTAGSSKSVLSVNPGAGSLTDTAGLVSSAYLGGVNTTDSDTNAVVTTSAIGDHAMYVDVLGRRVSSTTDYRARALLNANGTVTLALLALSAGTQTTLGAASIKNLTYTAGTKLDVRLQVYGTSPTTVRAKLWPAGTTEPTAWTVSATDSTSALQTSGSVGMSATLPSTTTNGPISALVSSFTSQKTGN